MQSKFLFSRNVCNVMLRVTVVHLQAYMHVPAVLRDQGCIQTQGCAWSAVRRMKGHNAARVAPLRVRQTCNNVKPLACI